MSGGFTGTPEQFQKAHQDVASTKATMDQNLSQLRDNIEATRAGWGGDAAQAFQKVMMRFDEKARNLTKALDDIGELLEQSGIKYQQAEEQQSEAVSAISTALGGL